jgi:hypothetical protein
LGWRTATHDDGGDCHEHNGTNRGTHRASCTDRLPKRSSAVHVTFVLFNLGFGAKGGKGDKRDPKPQMFNMRTRH